MRIRFRITKEIVVLGTALLASAVALGLAVAGVFVQGAVDVALHVLAAVLGVLVIGVLLYGFKLEKRMRSERDMYRFYDLYTQLPNELLLRENYNATKDKSKHALVMVRLWGYFQLSALFGLTIGGSIVGEMCTAMAAFAEKHGGLAYRLTQDRFALFVAAEDQQALLNGLRELFTGLGTVSVTNADVSYSHHPVFHYGTYFFAGAGGHEPHELSQIVAIADAVVTKLGDNERTVGVAFNQSSKPDWELQGVLLERVSEAWEKREFVPYYQLVYNLRSGKPMGAETLTRWEFPARGTIAPNNFLPVMQLKGLMMDLDLYMLEEACKKIRGWIDAELVTVPLSVNIAKLNVHRADFVERVIAIIRAYDIPPILLELELSEAVMLFEKTPEFLEVCRRLRRFGVSLTMDKFAESVFCSVNLLRELPVDVVKISPRFFERVEESPKERVFVSDVLTMLRNMNVKVIVTGVETEEQVKLYQQFNCEYGQGFYFSPPVSNAEFEKLIF